MAMARTRAAAVPTEMPTICPTLRLLTPFPGCVCPDVSLVCADAVSDAGFVFVLVVGGGDALAVVLERGGAVIRVDSVDGGGLRVDVVDVRVGVEVDDVVVARAVVCSVVWLPSVFPSVFPATVVVTVLVDWDWNGITCVATMVACVSAAALLWPAHMEYAFIEAVAREGTYFSMAFVLVVGGGIKCWQKTERETSTHEIHPCRCIARCCPRTQCRPKHLRPQ